MSSVNTRKSIPTKFQNQFKFKLQKLILNLGCIISLQYTETKSKNNEITNRLCEINFNLLSFLQQNELN